MTQLELSTFLAIVKYGNISVAAEKLYITQPAISRRLQTLESELGCTLIKRRQGKKTIELTNEGIEFISVAERWLAVWRDATNLSRTMHLPEFTAILNPSMGTHVPLAINDFIKRATGIKFKFHVYHSVEAYQWMEYGRADLALISKTLNNASVHTIPAYKESMHLIARNLYGASPALHPRQLDVSQELMMPWSPDFTDWHDFWFGSAASSKIWGDSPETLQHFWRTEKKWWSIVPASFMNSLTAIDGVRELALTEAPQDLVIYYLVNKNGKSRVADEFLQCLDKRVREVEGITSCMELPSLAEVNRDTEHSRQQGSDNTAIDSHQNGY